MDATTISIDRERLERVLGLQARAYAALLWLNARSERDPSLLSEKSLDLLRSESGTLEWLAKMAPRLPPEARPAADDGVAFGRLLSAFLRTSFHVEDGRAGRRLALGPAATAVPRSRRKRLARQRAAAEALEVLALTDLAREDGLALAADAIGALASREDLVEDVRLWTYAHEIVRRSLFASQGPAVLRLWRDMDPARRKRLDASHYWACRERIVAHLRAAAAHVAGP